MPRGKEAGSHVLLQEGFPLRMAASEDRRCAYFVQKRGRHCRMLAAKGSTYCGEHLIHDNALALSEPKGLSQLRRRIPCPLDSTHTVFEDTLHKHLKKCNAAKQPKPSCYSAHINTGLIDYQPSDEEKLPLSAFSTERIDELVKKVELAYQEHFTEIKREILYHFSMESELSDPRNGASALKHLQQQSSILGHLDALGILSAKDVCYIEFGAGRGKLSGCIQKSFKSHSDDPPLLADCASPAPPPPTFEAEMKNVSTKEHELQAEDLTLEMQQKANSTSTTREPSNVHYVLVDRDSCRHKVDGTHRVSTLVGAHYHRILMDIEHLDLRKLECLSDGSNIKQVVAISKHLCGAATDLTLRCIIQTWLQKPSVASHDECSCSNSYRQKLCGVLIALCCHHRCSWQQLVGRSFFERLGFTPVDFHLLCHMSSWAVCGVRPPPKSTGDVVEDVPKASAEDNKQTVLKKQDELSTGVKNTGHVRWGYVSHPNEEIGLKCKRLIDLARLEFLKEKGLNAWLVYYVDRSTSLENVLLIAMP